MSFRIRTGLALCAVFLAACTDQSPTAPAAVPEESARQELVCRVTLADRQMRCAAPGARAGLSANVILGGQGTYVRLASANLTVSGGFATVDVTVQNLLNQQMGTDGGTTPYGVKVFFHTLVTSGGTGAVTVENVDGHGEFTGLSQPYYAYPAVLEPMEVSAPRQWKFGVPATVTAFTFSVYVETRLPSESGTLRWVRESGPAGLTITGVWAASDQDVFAVGYSGFAMRSDGSSWRPVASGTGISLRAITGTSRDNVYAVGDWSTVVRYDGKTWRELRGSDQREWYNGVWASGSRVLVVGWSATSKEVRDGVLLSSDDYGATWTRTILPGSGQRVLTGVSATADGRTIVIAGYQTNPETGWDEAVFLRSTDGAATWTTRIDADSAGTRRNTSVWTDGSQILMAAYTQNSVNTCLLMRSMDGGATWSEDAGIGPGFTSLMLVRSPTSILVNTSRGVAEYNGTGWYRERIAISAPVLGGITATPSGTLYVGGGSGEIATRRNGTWTVSSPGTAAPYSYGRMSGRPGSRMMVASQSEDIYWNPLILRETPDGWVVSLPPQSRLSIDAVLSISPSDAYAVGGPFIWHWNGSEWSRYVGPDGPVRDFHGVWADGTGRVYVAGTENEDGVVLVSSDNGVTWTEVRRSVDVRYWGIGGTGPDDVYAVGERPLRDGSWLPIIHHFDGAQWDSRWAGVSPGRFLGVKALDSGEVIAYGSQGGMTGLRLAMVSVTLDRGESWATRTFSYGGGLARYEISDLWGMSGVAYAVGTDGPILQYNRGAWSKVDVQGGFSGVWGSSPTNVYAVGANGLVVHGTR